MKISLDSDSSDLYNSGEAGKTIRWYRRSFNMTQKELAKLIGTSFPLIARWEKGTDGMNVRSLVKLAKVFGISETELIHPSDEVRKWINVDLKETQKATP